MAEERRIYLRIAAFTGGAAIVYWFVSYELTGTALLAAVTLATIGLAVMLGRLASEPSVPQWRKVVDVASFEDPAEGKQPPQGEDSPGGFPLELRSAPLPALSLQPLLLALGAGAVTAGLVFGAWLWLPGAVVLIAAGWRWLVELDPGA